MFKSQRVKKIEHCFYYRLAFAFSWKRNIRRTSRKCKMIHHFPIPTVLIRSPPCSVTLQSQSPYYTEPFRKTDLANCHSQQPADAKQRKYICSSHQLLPGRFQSCYWLWLQAYLGMCHLFGLLCDPSWLPCTPKSFFHSMIFTHL